MSSSLTSMISQAELLASKMEQAIQEMESKMQNNSLSGSDLTSINESNLRALEKSIMEMSKACISKTDNISQTLSNLESDIRAVDGLMLGAKGKVGVSILKDYVKRQKIPDAILNAENSDDEHEPNICYEPHVESPEAGENINFDVYKNFGIPFDDPKPEEYFDVPLIRKDASPYYELHWDYFQKPKTK